MTQEQAREKWCPFARIGSSVSGLGGLNREPDGTAQSGSLCIASDCMAWRFILNNQTASVLNRPDGDGWVEVSSPRAGGAKYWQRPNPDGFCGLAGRLV